MIKKAMLLVILVLAMTAAGCSIAVKGGVHRFSSSEIEELRDNPTISVWELEFGVYEFAEQKVDLAVAVDLPEGPDGTDFQDFRFTGRYHFRRDKRVSPYAGGGVGWYRWFTKGNFEIPPPICEPIVSPDECVFLENVTISSGLYPQVVGGLNVRLTPSVDFVAEGRLDFAKSDGPLDFGAAQVLVGIRGRLGQ